MSSSALNQSVLQAKINNVQNQADTSAIYSNGVWSFKNSTALTSVTITDAGAVTLGPSGFTGNHVVNGNVGIGTASPARRLHVNSSTLGSFMQFTDSGSGSTVSDGLLLGFYSTDAEISNQEAGPIVFRTNNAERMRIDASGNLLVGTTSSQARAVIWDAGGSNPTVRVFKNAASTLANPCLTLDKYDNNTTTSQVFAQFTVNNQGTASGQINANGANQVAFGSWSDERLKENIADLQPQLENILALRPVEFDYIESEGGGHQIGFVAQEMQQVYADAIGERADGMLSISGWDKTTARLVKAIQELSAKNEALEARLAASDARLAALEAK